MECFLTVPRIIFLLLTCLKLLLVNSYYSTDLEVHRNWMAITANKWPPSKWYYDNTSMWTLDYPTLFAWFEWLLAQIARQVDERIVQLTAESVELHVVIVFQRLSVIIADFALYYAVGHYCRAPQPTWLRHSNNKRGGTTTNAANTTYFLVLAHAGLIIVDHIHFQYNGLLLAVYIFSISCHKRGQHLRGATAFVTLLNLKHIFLYIAPAYFVYLLSGYCYDRQRRFLLQHFVALALSVIAVFAISLGPFVEYLPQLARRLFPVQRGLSHAYWAPNFWAAYNFMDRVFIALVRRFTDHSIVALSTTAGLVTEIEYVFLPKIKPVHTIILALVFMFAGLRKLWFSPRSEVFVASLQYVFLTSFMFGYHVHEKAILYIIIPMALLSVDSLLAAKSFMLLSVTGTFSLFPLLYQSSETLTKYVISILYHVLAYCLLYRHHENQQAERRIQFNGFLSNYEKFYIFGFLPLSIFTGFFMPHFLPQLPFMPLMCISLYCFLGTAYTWYLVYCNIGQSIQLIDDECDN